MVPEAVRVHLHAALSATAGDHLEDPAGRERPPVTGAEPQFRAVRERVPGAHPQVADQAAGGLVPDLDGPHLGALAADGDFPLPQVNVAAPWVVGVVTDPRQLGQADPARLEDRDDGRVAPLLETAARADTLQPRQFLIGKTGTGLPATCGGLSPAIGSGRSSSAASHLKNCCSARKLVLTET